MKTLGRHCVLAAILASVYADDNAFLDFDDSECADPASVSIYNPPYNQSCTAAECSAKDGSTGRMHYSRHLCNVDLLALASATFGTAPYLVVQYYDESCTTPGEFHAISADGKCHVVLGQYSATVTLNSDGSAVLTWYKHTDCTVGGENYGAKGQA